MRETLRKQNEAEKFSGSLGIVSATGYGALQLQN
jgi:hypothetical protein